MKTVVTAIVSICTRQEKSQNLKRIEHFVRSAAAKGAEWVVLPELFHFSGDYAHLWDNADEPRGEMYHWLQALARDLKIVLFAGSIGERSGDAAKKRVYNAMYVFDRAGKEIGHYKKIHLFSLFDDKGNKSHSEEDGYLAGDTVTTIDVEGWHVGLAICYDLRFAEMFARMGRTKPVDAIVLPSAFTHETGMAHWEVLVRARAIENLCFCVASNQTGVHRPGRRSFGHGLIVDPWGRVLANLRDDEGFELATMQPNELLIARRRLPALLNRRPELYR
jgi:deaminated glutathione amidase